ncbi:MAG: hypothetical protein R3E02_03910 [Blastomonas sp.]
MTGAGLTLVEKRDGFDEAYASVRGDEAIQYVTPSAKLPESPPDWLLDLLRWIGEALGPVGKVLAIIWPFLRIGLLVLLAVAVAILIYVVLRPYLDAWRERKARPKAEQWVPDREIARQLLAEADALAGEGRFDEAAHLLLFRSIEDIEKRKPDLLTPSNTAREIGALSVLSERARAAFGVISSHVEASFFARRPLDRDAWDASRSAYSRFALEEG